MNSAWDERIIGLAGIFQAADVVDQLARTGYLNTDDFETCIKSLFIRDPESTISVYGSIHKLQRGFEVLERTFSNHRSLENRDVIRYGLGVILLQMKLAKRSEMLYSIATRLEAAESQIEHFSLTHDNVIANLADIYTDTISKFQYRIQVTGEYHYLQQARVANQVRALLLAGIRAATLWRQCGGNRLQFLLHRKKIQKTSQELAQAAKEKAHQLH